MRKWRTGVRFQFFFAVGRFVLQPEFFHGCVLAGSMTTCEFTCQCCQAGRCESCQSAQPLGAQMPAVYRSQVYRGQIPIFTALRLPGAEAVAPGWPVARNPNGGQHFTAAGQSINSTALEPGTHAGASFALTRPDRPANARHARGRSLSGLRNAGYKATAAVHFSPAFCPIAGLWGCKPGKN